MKTPSAGTQAEWSESQEKKLKAAFDRMEALATDIQEARRSGDRRSFEAAIVELRRAQILFLRDLNRFPAETARFLARRQEQIFDHAVVEGCLAEDVPHLDDFGDAAAAANQVISSETDSAK